MSKILDLLKSDYHRWYGHTKRDSFFNADTFYYIG